MRIILIATIFLFISCGVTNKNCCSHDHEDALEVIFEYIEYCYKDSMLWIDNVSDMGIYPYEVKVYYHKYPNLREFEEWYLENKK